jgi:DNA modification methylase
MLQVTEQPHKSSIHEELITDFCQTLGEVWTPTSKTTRELEDIAKHLSVNFLKPLEERSKSLFSLINSKFRFNRNVIGNFLEYTSSKNIFFNYPEKVALSSAFDSRDHDEFRRILEDKNVGSDIEELLLAHFTPIDTNQSLRLLKEAIVSSGKKQEILNALFGGYVFHSFGEETLHKLFNEDSREKYLPHFFDHLQHFYPSSVKRDKALYLLTINDNLIDNFDSYTTFQNHLFRFIKKVHKELTNHCYFFVLIETTNDLQKADLKWQIYSDLVLFSEKFKEEKLQKGYFHPKKIAEITKIHIPKLDENETKFDIANDGFYYKDCFILTFGDLHKAANLFEDYKLLVVLQKNERDETLIPCPACRSKRVHGNSYPVLGVRSWECENPFCPEKSKFDRGNRYSLTSLINQEAIDNPNNQIPLESVRKWKLDVVPVCSKSEIIDLLLRHYTLHSDTAVLVNTPLNDTTLLGRSLTTESFLIDEIENTADGQFFNSSYFKRFLVVKNTKNSQSFKNLTHNLQTVLHHGDVFDVLQTYRDNFFDGAVTSPPYYNAKDYSKWSNIYTYLYDMFNISSQIFRVLKPGAPFLFNIFDYFDNENNIVFSAMGKKRIILGAYIINILQRVGFQIQRNIIWHKGEIEGKRNFNQGNMSPYYQTPLNCYEHIFLFTKGESNIDTSALPSILRQKPIMKYFNGGNTLGHDAPFPSQIPELLLKLLPKGSTILEPFAGSMTTGLLAHERGYKSVNVEIHKEYCELGLELFRRRTHRRSEQELLFTTLP